MRAAYTYIQGLIHVKEGEGAEVANDGGQPETSQILNPNRNCKG